MLEYFDKLRFHCCSCDACVEWGQTQCPQCHSEIVKGMSAPLDRLLSIGLYILVVAGLVVGILIINQNLLAGAISFAGVVGIAIVIAAIKFNIRLGMRLNPKHAEVKLELLPIRSDAYWKNEIFEFRPERWTKEHSEYPSIYDLFQDGLSLVDTVKILDHFSDDKALDLLDNAIMTEGEDLLPYCIRSLIRIGNKRANSILINILSDTMLNKFREMPEIFSSEDLQRLQVLHDEMNVLKTHNSGSILESPAISSASIPRDASSLTNVTHDEFWRLTWNEWQNGILSPLFRSEYGTDFNRFMKAYKQTSKRLHDFNFYKGEYLFVDKWMGIPKRMYLLLTNYRLWIRSNRQHSLSEIWLQDIDKIAMSNRIMGPIIKIHKRDGEILEHQIFDMPPLTLFDLALTANRKPNLISDSSENTHK